MSQATMRFVIHFFNFTTGKGVINLKQYKKGPYSEKWLHKKKKKKKKKTEEGFLRSTARLTLDKNVMEVVFIILAKVDNFKRALNRFS